MTTKYDLLRSELPGKLLNILGVSVEAVAFNRGWWYSGSFGASVSYAVWTDCPVAQLNEHRDLVTPCERKVWPAVNLRTISMVLASVNLIYQEYSALSRPFWLR